MVSVAERKRRRKSSRRAVALADPVGQAPRFVPAVSKAYVRRKTGLECLAARGKINTKQRARGEAYGRLYRVAAIADGAAIPSALGDLDRVRGTGGAGLVADYSVEILEARKLLDAARAALGFHTGMVLACDMICGRTETPQDITKVRREAEELETALRIALDLLDEHWGDMKGWWT